MRARRGRDARTPRVQPVDPQGLTPADADALRTDRRVDGLLIEGGDLSGADLTDLVLDECRLVRTALGDVRADGARITDSVLDGVAATTWRAHRAVLRDVLLTGCRIGAAEWFEADLTRVELIGCRIDYLGLADARAVDLRLVDCTVGDLDLRGATAERVALVGCRVRELSALGATLQHVDLRGADLERVDGVRALRGTVVSDEQLLRIAPLLAEEAGIAVE